MDGWKEGKSWRDFCRVDLVYVRMVWQAVLAAWDSALWATGDGVNGVTEPAWEVKATLHSSRERQSECNGKDFWITNLRDGHHVTTVAPEMSRSGGGTDPCGARDPTILPTDDRAREPIL